MQGWLCGIVNIGTKSPQGWLEGRDEVVSDIIKWFRKANSKKKTRRNKEKLEREIEEEEEINLKKNFYAYIENDNYNIHRQYSS